MSSAPLLLALTTATDACGAALWRDDRLVSELTLHRPRRHAERLTPLIRDVLTHGDAAPHELDAVALAAGPGSYTGLRIGASTAKGLVAATGAQLVAIPTLEALAETARPYAAAGDLLFPALRSRRREVYAAAYLLRDEALVPLFAAEALASDEAARRLGTLRSEHAPPRAWLLGEGAPRLHDALSEAERTTFRTVADALPSAGAVARLGVARWTAGTVEDAAAFEPRYLKPFHATPRRQSVFEGLS